MVHLVKKEKNVTILPLTKIIKLIVCLLIVVTSNCVVTGTICNDENRMTSCITSFDGIKCSFAEGALHVTDLVLHHYNGFRLYSDKGRPEIYKILPPPTCSLTTNLLFHPHHSGVGNASARYIDGV